MRLLNTYKNEKKGFTLIELVIALAIIAFLATFGIITGLDSFARYNFRGEIENAVLLLQKARSEAINNIAGLPHGVYFADPSKLVLFSGIDYASRDSARDVIVQKAKSVRYSGLGEVVFSQLSGQTPRGLIDIIDNTKSVTITINNEGGIDW